MEQAAAGIRLEADAVDFRAVRVGFEQAFGLEGGMTAWTQAGLPVVTGKKTKSKNKSKSKQ